MNQKALSEIGQIMADGYPTEDKVNTSQEMASLVEMVLPDLADRASPLLAQGKDKVEEVWHGIKENSEAFFQPALRNIERPKVIYAASKFMNNKLIGTLITKQAIELDQSRKEG